MRALYARDASIGDAPREREIVFFGRKTLFERRELLSRGIPFDSRRSVCVPSTEIGSETLALGSASGLRRLRRRLSCGVHGGAVDTREMSNRPSAPVVWR